jgi:hypothetical protein
MDKQFEKGRTITKEDGTVMVIFDGKLHNWEGPALIPEGIKRKREYYLNGIKYSEADWNERVKGRDGLPWYKGAGAKARF